MKSALALNPFTPLSSNEIDMPAGVDADVLVITPVPDDALLAHFRHGVPSATWTYRDKAGRVLGHVARFETETGKEILPLTWCRLADGRHLWRWHAFSAPRPLYGLDRLGRFPDAAVLLVEGEKTADAA